MNDRSLPPSFVGPAEVALGTVAATTAHTNCVIVHVPGHKPRPAILSTAMGNYGLGARETKTLECGTQVVVLLLSDYPWDYVVGITSQIVDNPSRTPNDSAAAAGGTNFFGEAPHAYPVLNLNGPLNASGGTLADLMSGEWAMTNEFGVGVAVERFCAWLRTDEMCGVWASFVDHSLRVAGKRLVLETYGSEETDTYDDEELNRVYMRAYGPAESVGLPETEAFNREFPEYDAETGAALFAEGTDALAAAREPLNPEAVMMPRYMELDGRFGDITQRMVVTPDPDKNEYTLASPDDYTGLFRERVGTDGSLLIETRSGIHITKTPSIPIPKRIQRHTVEKEIEDSTHRDTFEWAVEDYRSAGIVAQAQEAHAFLINNQSYRNFLQRSDWNVEEIEAEKLIADDAELPGTSSTNLWAEAPNSIDQQIHPDRDPQKFFHSAAGIHILDDGSVRIVDGWGSELVMSGGNIFTSCSGDIYELPGRNKVTWAPGDVVQRAGEDVDLSTSRGDIRIKSERNLSVLVANGGEGGLLLDDRGEGTEFTTDPGSASLHVGITFKTTNPINFDSPAFRVVTEGVTPSGDQGIHLIDRGDSDGIQIESENGGIAFQADTQMTFSYGDGENARTSVFNADSLVLDATQVAAQGSFIAGQAVTAGTFMVAYSGFFCDGPLFVTGDCGVNGAMAVYEGIDAQVTNAQPRQEPVDEPGSGTNSQFTTESEYSALINEAISESREAGVAIHFSFEGQGEAYDEARETLSFSFRLDDDYKLGHDEFWLPQFAWQRRMAARNEGEEWVEPTVSSPGGAQTLPHPGLETWNTNGKQLVVDDNFANSETGLSPNRDPEAAPESPVTEQPLSEYRTNT